LEAPELLVRYLQKNQYHPRSDKHSNFICDAILDDLIENCPELAARAATGAIVAKPRHKQIIGYNDWVIDLALGEPSATPKPPPDDTKISIAVPAVIQIAIEAKSVMTEHKKARKNRLRDLQAFHSHAHEYSPDTIAVGLVVINASRYFWSPLRKESDITDHGNIGKLATEITDTFRAIRLRNEPRDGEGMEAMGLIVVEHDNLNLNPNIPPNAPKPNTTKLSQPPLALPSGDPLHYSTMIRRICNAYKQRF